MIAILTGGNSSERQVALWTAKSFADSLRRQKIPFKIIDCQDNDWLEKLLAAKPRVAILALHGQFGEDGTIQKILEKHHIGCTGSDAAASAKSWDKNISRQVATDAGVIVPSTVKAGQSFPVVVKPAKEGSSYGVSIVHEASELSGAIKLAKQYDKNVIIEEYIQGTEVTCGDVDVFGQIQALPIVEIRPKKQFFDFDAKYDPKFCEEIVPAPLPDEVAKNIQRYSKKLFRTFNCRQYARIDYIVRANKPYFLEINTLPGMTVNSLLPKALRAEGIELDDFVRRLIDTAK